MKNQCLSLFMTILFSFFSNVNAEANTTCTSLVTTFADATSAFTFCAISNSRPITLCQECVDSYINVLESYHNMSLFSENGTLCIDTVINLDSLQIVHTLYTNSFDLWNRAKCYKCFQIDDGILTPNKSNDTIQFDQYYDDFMHCINQKTINDTTICPNCINVYVKLDNFYKGITNENEKIGVCMDIVDLMNSTRVFWSLKCCKYRRHDEYIFLITTLIILGVTPLFYIIVNKCSTKKTPTILQQTRFAESLTQLNNHRED